MAQFDDWRYSHEHSEDLVGQTDKDHQRREDWNGAGLTWPNVREKALSCDSKRPTSTIPTQYVVGIATTDKNWRNG